MGFVLIKGAFAPDLGQPDGDSVRFIADDLANWSKLKGEMDNLGSEDSIQLRFEGIDAIEKTAIQPLATQAKDGMKALLGAGHRPRGYILSKRFEQNGRPVAFAFPGSAAEADGSPNVFLTAERLRASVNWGQVRNGFAYPLYYNTLFKQLRVEFDAALGQARAAGAGYWPTDASLSGVNVVLRADLFSIPPIWPKLWRRLEEYLRTPRTLAGFKTFIKNSGERADDLTTFEQKSMEHFIEVNGANVRLNVAPENIRVVSRP